MLSGHVQQVLPDRNAKLWEHCPTGGFGAAVVSETPHGDALWNICISASMAAIPV